MKLHREQTKVDEPILETEEGSARCQDN